MTNWPNIQEYRNFEAKFFDNTKQDNLNKNNIGNSVEELEFESVPIKCNKDSSPDWTMDNSKSYEPKTVRCVIRKDFEETFKKFDRGDGLLVNNQELNRPKLQEGNPIMTDQTIVDKVRLENHLKWKKQKEEEFWRKREAEREAQRRRKEEEMRLQKMKKQKEKEAEEKMREWQEQKAREKEGKKREKIMLKALEEELKEVTPVVDKEKLIEDWVKLKDKQRLIEAEKKAEIIKREEESRNLRQNLAALSYRQWKEKIKGRMMTLPKNGYQIFGPKPTPVVKEDWNHDFAKKSPRNQVIALRNSKSTISNSTYRSGTKEIESISKEIFYAGETKAKNPSFFRLKHIRSGIDLCSCGGKETEMPLKELQPETIGSKKDSFFGIKNGFPEKNINFHALRETINPPKLNWFRSGNSNGIQTDSKDFEVGNEISTESLPPDRGGNQFRSTISSHGKQISKQSVEQTETTSVPIKKKIELYINSPGFEGREKSRSKYQKTAAGNKPRETKKPVENKTNSNVDSKGKIISKKSSTQIFRKKSKEVLKASSEMKLIGKNLSPGLKESMGTRKMKICRRSRSYDKPTVKRSLKDLVKIKGRSSSRSSTKIEAERGPTVKKLEKMGKSQKRKIRIKQSKKSNANADGREKNEKNDGRDSSSSEMVKSRKKSKKKIFNSSKPFSSIEVNPYSVKKTPSKSVKKSSRKKTFVKSGETSKIDGAERSRKSATKKIS